MLYSQHLHERLRTRVVGQDLAVREMVRALTLARARIDGRRPLGVYLFLGPTGTGKSALAAAVAEELFGRDDLVVPIHVTGVQGVVNFVEALGFHVERCGGIQTEQDAQGNKVRYCQAVVVIEDFQDVPADIMSTVCHMIDHGQIQLGSSETFDFSRALFVFMSRLCAERIDELNRASIGFQGSPDLEDNDEIDEKIYVMARKCVETELPPEFVGRLDRVVVFKRLRRSHLPALLDQVSAEVLERLQQNGLPRLELRLEDELKAALLTKAERRLYLGARPLIAVVRKYVLFPLADLMVSGALRDGSIIVLGLEDGRSTARIEATPEIGMSPPLRLLPGRAARVSR